MKAAPAPIKTANVPLPREPRFAPEGRPFFLPPLGAALLFFLAGAPGTGWFMLVLGIAVALFFRNPARQIPTDPTLLVSPADGTILSVGEPESSPNRLAGQMSRRVTIFLSVLNVHVNRYPCGGRITRVAYNPGKFLAAFNEKASLDNEQQATTIETAQGWQVMVIQIAGLIARRIVCYAQDDQEVNRGHLMGLIRFGSRVDIWLPAEWPVLVKPRQKVVGGESAIAQMVQN